jgi:hypothetical protein
MESLRRDMVVVVVDTALEVTGPATSTLLAGTMVLMITSPGMKLKVENMESPKEEGMVADMALEVTGPAETMDLVKTSPGMNMSAGDMGIKTWLLF